MNTNPSKSRPSKRNRSPSSHERRSRTRPTRSPWNFRRIAAQIGTIPPAERETPPTESKKAPAARTNICPEPGKGGRDPRESGRGRGLEGRKPKAGPELITWKAYLIQHWKHVDRFCPSCGSEYLAMDCAGAAGTGRPGRWPAGAPSCRGCCRRGRSSPSQRRR